jgi:hypothetical protein
MSTLIWGFPNQEAVTSQQVGGLQQYKEVTITSAQLMAGVAVTILPAPGPGLYNELVKVIAEVNPGVAPTNLGACTNLKIAGQNYGTIYSFKSDILTQPAPVYAVSNFANWMVWDSTNLWMQSNYMFIDEAYEFFYDSPVTFCDNDVKLKIWYITRKFG